MRVVGPGVFVDAGDDGYYLVLRSVSRGARMRDVDISFYGPFPTPAQAIFMATSARALGLTGPEPQPQRAEAESEMSLVAAADVRVRHLRAP